jgi:TorA-specific chaperone
MSASGRLGTRGGGGVAAELLDWLAGLLSAPMSIGTVAACRSREGAVFFDAINDEFGYMPGVDAMRCAIEADESDEQVAARLSGCYMRLFEGPGGPATVSLYESTYAGTTRRCDMAVRAGYGEPPDHLSLEAGLLASLLRIDDQDAADELRQRLLGWVPRVTTACAAADPSGFYRGVLIAMHDTLMVLHAPTPVRTCHERSS